MTTHLEHGALLTDQYELTMAQVYVAEGMRARATFSLFSRRLPEERGYLLTCGIDSVLAWLESLRFSSSDLDYLASLGTFSDALLEWLADFRFEGDVRAMPEGTLAFAEEPIVEVDAPIAQAQLVETFVMNQIHSQTVLASKASRVVQAASGTPVVDFGLRRMHGADAGVMGARAYHIAGIASTSNVQAGKMFGVPISGTMAHSFIEAFDDELDAFRAFAAQFPETTLLVDTYDTAEGVKKVVALAHELGDRFRVWGIRLDSGDLGALAAESRAILDEAGLNEVRIVASSGLNEHSIGALVAEERPIDGFGIGTSMGVSADAPKLDMAYKLVEYADRGRMKLSTGKRTLPGRKQVFRESADGRLTRDVIAREGETLPGRPLLRTVMRGGQRTDEGREPLETARERAQAEIAALPARLRSLAPIEAPHEVALSESMRAHLDAVRRRVEAGR